MNVETLTAQEIDDLTEDDRETYLRAVELCSRENAGGPGGGWANGHDLLKSLGWTEVSRVVGHRRFVSLRKPEVTA